MDSCKARVVVIAGCGTRSCPKHRKLIVELVLRNIVDGDVEAGCVVT